MVSGMLRELFSNKFRGAVLWILKQMLRFINTDHLAAEISEHLPPKVVAYAMLAKYAEHQKKFTLSKDDKETLTNFLVPAYYGRPYADKHFQLQMLAMFGYVDTPDP